jgi:hypothetical protein
MPPKRNPSRTKAAARRPAANEAPARAAARKDPVKWKRKPAGGLFAKALLHNLKTMPPGTSAHAMMLEAIRSVPPEKVKAAWAKATPKERSLVFSVIPPDQIEAILGQFIEPVEPPEPPPSPAGGPPASILQTTYTNVPYPPAETDRDWAKKITDGHTVQDVTSPPVYEWTPVYDQRFEKEGSLNNPVAGLTGWVVSAKNPGGLSGGDVWFTHPFGFDWEYYIVPDPQYESLLAATNTGTDPDTGEQSDQDYHDATGRARDVLGLQAPFGVLGVEIDQDLVPASFRNQVTDGARIASFGRWIVDTGHPDFHTEIHPPLVTAVAKPAPPPRGTRGASEMTHVDIMSRPYTVSQRFAEGNFVDHLIAEVTKVETTVFGFPLSWRVEAHPTVYTTPYEGRPYIKLLVKPPVPRSEVEPQQLIVNYHFTHRAGVAVQVFDAGNDTVGIIIVLGDLNPAQLTRKYDWNIPWSDLGTEYAWFIGILQLLDLLFDPFGIYILSLGILTDRYDAPIASSPGDNQNVAGPVPVDQLQAWAGSFEDDTQPFPIYGWLNVYWEQEQVIVIE